MGVFTMVKKRSGFSAFDVENTNAQKVPLTPQAQAAADKVTRIKLMWALCPWGGLIAFLTYLDRSSLAFAAPQMIPDLHLDGASYGLGAGLLFVTYSVFMLPGSVLVEKLGAPTGLAVATVSWGVITALTSLVRSAPAFFAVRLALGAAEACCFPGLWVHLTLFFTQEEMTYAYSVVLVGTVVSQMVGGPIASGLLLMDGLGGLRGWQWIFILEGALTIAYGLVLKFVLIASPETAWCLTEQERARVAERVHEKAAAAQEPASASAWQWILQWRLWLLGFCFYLVQTTFFSVLFWVPLILEAILTGNFGVGVVKHVASSDPHAEAEHTSRLALLSTVLYVPMGLSMCALAFTSMRFRERNLHCFVSLATSGAAFMLVPVTMSAWGPTSGYAMLVLAALGITGAWGPIASWPALLLSGRARAPGYGFFNSFAGWGGFTGPYILGVLSRHGFELPMYVLGGCNLLAACILLFFRVPVQQQCHALAAESAVGSLKGRGSGADAGQQATEFPVASDSQRC